MAGVYDLQTQFYNAVVTALPTFTVLNGEFMANVDANGTAMVSVVITSSTPDAIGAGIFWASTGLCRVSIGLPYTRSNESTFVGHEDSVRDALREITGTQAVDRWLTIKSVNQVDGDRGIALDKDQDSPDARFSMMTFEFEVKERIP